MSMHKTATVNARIEPELKENAELILQELGLTAADSIRLMYKQICLQRALPFLLKIPNETTEKALKAADSRKTHKAKSSKHLIESI